MSDRRADARDSRLTDHDGTELTGRDESKKVGRVTLDEIDWDSAPERRDVLAEWMSHGTTPVPKPRRGRTRRRLHDDVEAWTADYPEFPTRIGDWRFLTDYTENDFLKFGYATTDGTALNFLGRVPRVVIHDTREHGGDIAAHVITDNVYREPAGSPAGAPIVTADDPETFRKRLVLYLDGEQPDEIVHPYYDPALERNLPAGWVYGGMIPTRTKAKHRWVWRPQDRDQHDAPAWRIFADGYVNGSYDVYAHTAGRRAPRYHADRWGVDVMPGDGAAVAAETARRIMAAINDDPTEPGTDPDPVETPADTLRWSYPDAPTREFTTGDRVAATFTNTAKGHPDEVEGELIGWEFIEAPPNSRDDDSITFTVRDDSGTEYVFDSADASVAVDGRRRGHTRRSGYGELRLVERGSFSE